MAHRQIAANGKKFLLLSSQYFSDLLRRAKLADSTQLRKTLALDEAREQIADRPTPEKPPYRKRKHLEKSTRDFLREKDRAVDLTPAHHGYVKKGRIGVIVDRSDGDETDLLPPQTPPHAAPLPPPQPQTWVSPGPSEPSTIHPLQSPPNVDQDHPDESFLMEPAQTSTHHYDPDDTTEPQSTLSEPQTCLQPLVAPPKLASASTTSSPTTQEGTSHEVEQAEVREDPEKPKFSDHNIINRLLQLKNLSKYRIKSMEKMLEIAKGEGKRTDWDEKTGKLLHQPGKIEPIIKAIFGKLSTSEDWPEGMEQFLTHLALDPDFLQLGFADFPNIHTWKYIQTLRGVTPTTRRATATATALGKGNSNDNRKKKSVRWKGLVR